MDFDVLDEKENVFFARKELYLKIRHPGLATPKKQELIKELSEKYSVTEEQVIVDFIFSRKGITESTAKVKIYKEKQKIKQKKEEVKSEAQTSEAK